jgi:monothiol glutaredoxin
LEIRRAIRAHRAPGAGVIHDESEEHLRQDGRGNDGMHRAQGAGVAEGRHGRLAVAWGKRFEEHAVMREILDESHIHPAIREKIASGHRDIVDEVKAAIAANDVVVVGMAMNPFPRKVRKALDAAGIPYKYLGYGSYLREWRRRSALKMWTGWQTFPMVFVKGTLVGGFEQVAKLIASGELKRPT